MAEKVSEKVKKKKRKPKPSPPIQTSTSNDRDDICVDKRPSIDDELEWCIKQLEIGLLRPKITSDQKREAQQLIKKLSSTKTPLPRKRQLMHNQFGNYRQKMKEQPLPVTKPPSLWKATATSSTSSSSDDAVSNTGTFYKRTSSKSTPSTCDQSFAFNFDISD